MSARPDEDDIELPTLRPPPGAIGHRSGSGGSDNEREARAEFESSLSAIEMLDHFVPQLKEQGWTLMNRVADGELSVQTAKRTKNGQPLYLILSDARFGTRRHTMTVRVWREPGDP